MKLPLIWKGSLDFLCANGSKTNLKVVTILTHIFTFVDNSKYIFWNFSKTSSSAYYFVSITVAKWQLFEICRKIKIYKICSLFHSFFRIFNRFKMKAISIFQNNLKFATVRRWLKVFWNLLNDKVWCFYIFTYL